MAALSALCKRQLLHQHLAELPLLSHPLLVLLLLFLGLPSFLLTAWSDLGSCKPWLLLAAAILINHETNKQGGEKDKTQCRRIFDKSNDADVSSCACHQPMAPSELEHGILPFLPSPLLLVAFTCDPICTKMEGRQVRTTTSRKNVQQSRQQDNGFLKCYRNKLGTNY